MLITHLIIKKKDYLLTFIILYSATLEFLEDNPNLFPSSNNSISNSVNNDKIDNIKSWPKWLSWKCLAGAAGMTVAGAAGGCYGGGQLGGLIGSVAGPAGTLSGAITGCGIGAVIGGISGALIGAATFC